MRYLLPIALLCLICGCQESALPAGTVLSGQDPHRDTEVARKHNAEGVEHLREGKLEKACENFQAALGADLFFGPAHNNLGIVYYRQRKLYQAACEFNNAIKLMPNKAEPRNNLGMVFEASGRYTEAERYYEEALSLEGENVEAAANLARTYVRQNRKDDRTRELLALVAEKDPRSDWADWARMRLIALKGDTPTSAPAGE